MPYNIGQIRRSEIKTFGNDIVYNQGSIINEDSIIDFYDPCLYLSGLNEVSSLYSYYLRFSVVQRTDSAQKFTIKLKTNELTDDNTEEIRTFNVQEGIGSTSFEIIFTPNQNYNEIIFELSRLALDFSLQNSDGTSGRFMDITIEEFYLIRNIIDDLAASYSGLTVLSKIGIQGPPGLMFVINGEEIRIGRSGIYELYNNDISISYIGFIIKDSVFTQDGQDFFILDFKY